MDHRIHLCLRFSLLLKLALVINIIVNFSVNLNAVKTVRYDRIWVYDQYDYSYTDPNRYYMAFTDSIEKDGKYYHKFKVIKIILDYKNNPVVDDSFSSYYTLLRESDNKIYILCEWQSYEGFQCVERLLYNFELENGDKCTVYSTSMCALGTFTIANTEEIVIDNEVCKSQQYYELLPYYTEDEILKNIEGIGTTYNGTLDDPVFYPANGIHGHSKNLVAVMDRNYNIIYTTNTYTPIKVELQTENSGPSAIYDLLGRQLTNPSPGTIYIQNGKKFVAK